jgi:rare lipoprotein A (peptidoglycan hydrolase)
VVINDRGPYIAGRIIDLSDDAFAQLAPLGAGTINVRIAW